MPLLGRKVYIPRTQDRIERYSEAIFKVSFTNEVCKSKDEYEKRLEFYRQPIWTCQCTGVSGLSYQEACRSEVSAREQLEDEFPIRLERTVLELVHHSATPLDTLVNEVKAYLQNHFEVGETVELKVQLKGKIIRGKVLKITQSSSDEMKEGSSPSSDKENHVEDGSRTPGKPSKKINNKNFRYTIRLSDEDKIISSIPGHELIHTVPLPSCDLIKLFIRANAIQTGSSINSPWVVSEDLFSKFNLVNKYEDISLSPYKTTYETPKAQKRPAENQISKSSKKRKLSDQFVALGSPKMKQATLDMSFKTKSGFKSDSEDPNQMSSPEKVRMDHTYSSPIGKSSHKNSPKRSPKKAATSRKESPKARKSLSKTTLKKPKKEGAAAKKKESSGKTKDKKKTIQKSKPVKDDKGKVKKVRKTPIKKSSSEEEVIDVDTIQEIVSKISRKTPSKKKLTDHFKMLQGNSPSEDEFKVTPKKTPSKQAKNNKTTSPKSKTKTLAQIKKEKGKKAVTKVAKKSLTGTPKKAMQQRKTAKSPVKKTKTGTKEKTTKSPVKTPKKGTPKKSPAKKATPKKTPQKKGKVSPVKTPKSKKSLKQMTLFDLAGKKSKTPDSQVRYKLSTPQSPRQPPIITKLIRAKKIKDTALYNKMMSKAVKELNDKQIKNLKPEIKDEVTAKYEEYKMKLKWKTMTPEERKELMMQKREEKKKQRDEERQKKMEEERKMRLEQAKRFEDQDLKLKSLPTPKPVPMPDGLPNTLFGDVAMVVEFLNCYCGLLMPNDPYPVTADCLTRALAGGREGFAYLSRVLVILLKTLLQDKIAEDYKELSMSLSQIPVNMHTASELLRLSLRHDDQDNDDQSSSSGSDDFINDDEVPQEVVELLETSEFFELEPQEKLELLVFMCHRILASYAVQDFMDNKQKVAARLWRDKIQTLKEKNEKIKEEKQKLKEQREAERLQREEELRLKAEAAGATQNGEGSEVKPDEKPKEKKGRKKKDVKENKEETDSTNETEENLDLASVVKRRRLLAAKTKAEREEQEKIEREKRIKGEEEYKRMRAQEIFEKKFEDGIQQAKLALRQVPIGTDRNHSRYWVFSSVTPGLFIEKGWVESTITYSAKRDGKGNGGGRDDNNGTEKTFPKVGQNLWFQYESAKELDTLMEALDNQGIRESALYVEVKKRYQDISKTINLSRRSGPELRESDGPKELLQSLREDLLDIESHIQQGNLGGVVNAGKWEERVKNATKLKDLGGLIIESQAGVNPKFLQGIMAPPKPKSKPSEDDNKDEDRDEDSDQEEDEPGIPEKVAKWIEAVESAPTLSRLHLLLSVYEACVRWEKSSENAKCKICRRKGDEDQLLLCDECNQPFHLFCLRPALVTVPKGDWKCPACAPSTRRNARNRSYKGMDDSDESESSSDDEDDDADSDSEDSESNDVIEHEDICTVCSEAGELVLCAECPLAYHKDCHEPPMRNFPRGRWVCASCLNPARSSRSKRAEQKAKKEALAKKKKQRLTKKRKAQEEAKAAAKKTKIVFTCKIAEDIIGKMLRYRDSGPFRTMPDPADAPDYEEVIANPVDLHMLKDRCSCEEYDKQQEFLDDVRLLFTNAKQYYEDDEHVILQAQKLEDFYVNLLKWNLPQAVEAWQQGPSRLRQRSRNPVSRADDRADHSYGRRSLRQLHH
ncbi:tyrosine-protein kinase BAZ1B-like isoform X2 [Patiria miniata]|uniref:Tyrosine-protein kinase BAZ1B n=1 Tax=Patiria miniata TaxID=46514 RepID=A0A913ZQ46_PATMI|nr:tyrosine-protein kinase BAZ1B-like isoform X2 [Patiria miniata]